MEEQDMVQITVLIAGRPYPLKIKSGDEPTIRKIVKEINEKLNHFQAMYTKKDKQDCLSMALLTYAVDLHKADHHTAPTENSQQLVQKVTQLDELLDHLL
ncbi:MAG: cell division protein ZapA [Bacteroidota bacterium]